MARQKANEGALIEKTIFILKPLLVPYHAPAPNLKKMKYKMKHKKQKVQN